MGIYDLRQCPIPRCPDQVSVPSNKLAPFMCLLWSKYSLPRSNTTLKRESIMCGVFPLSWEGRVTVWAWDDCDGDDG